MKRILSLSNLALASGVAVITMLASCCDQKKEETPVAKSSIIESSSIVGLWQKETEATMEDADGNVVTYTQATNLYKCIMDDGTFFIFRASTDSLNNNVSQIELYGNYELSADTLCTELIVCHCLYPKLTGVTSEVHYNLPDNNLMNVWYNLKNADGTVGSNEWVPEVWKRVQSSNQ